MGLWEIIKGEQPGLINSLLHYENPGQFGEYVTVFALTNDNLFGYGKVMQNLYIPNKGKTTEVDVLVIHEKGIFVLESKNYSGWIFGSEEQPKWMQRLPNGQKNQFFNPIKQNRIHIRALSEFLEIPEEDMMSCIVFSERCELKKVPEQVPRCKVLRRPHLIRYLKGELKQRQVCYSHEQIDAMYAKLKPLTNASEEEKQKHVDDIKERMEGTTCPFCGEKLVLRKGKYGDFWGCSAYPKCRFTRRIEEKKKL